MKKLVVLTAIAGAVAAGAIVLKNKLTPTEDDVWTDATSDDVWPSQ